MTWILLYAACAWLLALLVRWYVKEAIRLRQRRRLAARLRQHRRALQSDQPFRPTQLGPGELQALIGPDEDQAPIGRSGRTTYQWLADAACDCLDGRREHMPTRAEFDAEFGRALKAYHRRLTTTRRIVQRRGAPVR